MLYCSAAGEAHRWILDLFLTLTKSSFVVIQSGKTLKTRVDQLQGSSLMNRHTCPNVSEALAKGGRFARRFMCDTENCDPPSRYWAWKLLVCLPGNYEMSTLCDSFFQRIYNLKIKITIKTEDSRKENIVFFSFLVWFQMPLAFFDSWHKPQNILFKLYLSCSSFVSL